MTARTGDVIWYPYLWTWQAERGESEGRKNRPCCMMVSRVDRKTRKTLLFLFAISSQPPTQAGSAIEVPALERRRAGLHDLKQAWVTVNEYNLDVLEDSFYYGPGSAPLGRFSDAFVRTILTELKGAIEERRLAGRVDRTRA